MDSEFDRMAIGGTVKYLLTLVEVRRHGHVEMSQLRRVLKREELLAFIDNVLFCLCILIC